MAQEGIATLPQAPENQASYGETMPFSKDLENVKAALAKDNPDAVPLYEQGMEVAAQQINLPIDELQALLTGLEYILKNEKDYPAIRKQLVESGSVDSEDLPEQFDRGYFTTMLVMTQEAITRKQRMNMEMSMPEPQGFAKGGLAGAAESLRQKGRGGDTILAHINPQEAMMLKAMGGSGTINPATGLLEFKGGGGVIGGIGKAIGGAVKAVGNAVKSVVSSPIGKIVATVALTAALGPGGLAIGGTLGAGAGIGAMAMAYAVPAALASGAVSLAGGSNLSTALREAAIAGVAGGAFGGLSGAGGALSKAIPSLGTGFLNTAVGAFGAGTLAGVASGQKIGDALKTGAISGITAGGISALGGQSAFGTETPVGGAPVTDRSTPFNPNEVSAGQITQAGGSIASPGAVTGADPMGGASGFGLNTAQGPSQFGLQAPGSSSGISSLSPSLPTAGAPTVATPGTYQPASFMDRAGAFMKSPSLSSFGDMMIAPSPTDAQLMNSDIFRQATAQGANFSTAMGMAKDALSPGMIAKYAPAVALGIGALGASGGFQSQPAATPGLVERDDQGNPITGADLIAQDPSRYIVQNLQGVSYTPTGMIDYTQGVNTPAYGMNNPTTISTPAYGAPPSYTTPGSAASQNPGMGIQQPYNTAANYDFMRSSPYYQPQRFYNMGGDVMGYQQGGSFPRKTGQIDGPGTGTSDSIPAMLSDGEFVLTAKAVKGVGNGSRRAGAKKLYRMMHAMEKKAGGKV
jgi:hypothetical protein